MNDIFKTFTNTFHAIYELSLISTVFVICFMISDKSKATEYFGLCVLLMVLATIFLISWLSTGLKLNWIIDQTIQSIIDYSTSTDNEKLSIEFKSNYSYFFVKELTKLLRLTQYFSKSSPNWLIKTTNLMLILLFIIPLIICFVFIIT